MDGGTGDAVALGQLSQTLPALAISEDRHAIQLQRLGPTRGAGAATDDGINPDIHPGPPGGLCL